ncbi:hypothetical protein EPI10_029062 [Gossypium australe]|uniref:Uncharacterized protein n=1 Tax=Gossypium australe TaxID=47621 RepID=A0A5B6V0C9_9ROSI|nr:hypothetical protein EPI10_029062 [Gossypium australe]
MTVALETNENLPTECRYDTRSKTKVMDQILERLEQIQKDMQDQLQAQLQEQLAKVQQDMRDPIQESQRSMAQPDAYSWRAPVTIRPQQYQACTSTPMNYPKGSSSNLGDNPTNPVLPDLDMAGMDKAKIDAKDLSLVPDLVLPPKFKTLEFEKYNGTSCPEAHITMFYQRMTGYTFMKQYSHVTDMTPDRITLQNIEKKQNESFSATKIFPNIVMSGEMIEKAIRSGKIYAGENAKRSAPRKKENELIERFIKMGIVKFDDPLVRNVAGNPLPSHSDQGVNTIIESGGRRTRANVAEERPKGMKSYCEFHDEEGHKIQECIVFRALVQSLMDNKEIEFYEEVKSSEEGEDSKKVPWNYDCNVMIPGEENLVSTSEEGQNVGFCMCSGRRYDPLKTRTELVKGKALAVEQKKEKMARLETPVNEPDTRSALMKVLNETYVTEDIFVNKLESLVNNISADNFIFFNDDKIPPGGMGSTEALHITTRCKGYTLLGVLINNGSVLNVLPLSTLNRLPVDSSHMKTCQNIVRTFDGTEKRAMGKIEIPLLIGPNTYEVDFLVMDIKPSYNFLLGRPWVHSAGAVPSSLHQKLKLVAEGRLVTINTEEDIIAFVTSDALYIGADDEAIECSFRSLEFVDATFIVEWDKILVPKISKTTRMGLQLTIGKGALLGKGLGRYLQ